VQSRGTAVLASTVLLLLVLVAPAHAAFPGKNGKIAFVSNRDGNDEIYSMDADGTGDRGRRVPVPEAAVSGETFWERPLAAPTRFARPPAA
jgi:hypothetical protein